MSASLRNSAPTNTADARRSTMKAVAVRPREPNSIHLRDVPMPSLHDIPGDRGPTGAQGATVTASVPATVPLYGVNLGGYRPAAFDAGSPNRIEFGGLSDAMFRVVPLIEAGRDATWPWRTSWSRSSAQPSAM